MKFVSLQVLKIRSWLHINKRFLMNLATRFGKNNFFLKIVSIIMEFADDGDLY